MIAIALGVAIGQGLAIICIDHNLMGIILCAASLGGMVELVLGMIKDD